MKNHHPRVVALQGSSNFRDLGGYVGSGGRSVQWGRLYRSDHLGELTPDDVRVVRQRGVASALDFRGVQESAAAAYEWDGITRVALSIEPTVAHRMQELVKAGRFLDEHLTVDLMEDLYRSIVRNQASRLRAFFSHLLETEHPMVFHCTAGKDRTGIAAALLLQALGVSRDDVMQDFLITNEVFRPPQLALTHGSPEAMQALWSVRPQYLQAAWAVMDGEFGGTEGYLREALSLSPTHFQQLERRYLQPI